MYSSNVVKAPKMMDDHPDPVLLQYAPQVDGALGTGGRAWCWS